MTLFDRLMGAASNAETLDEFLAHNAAEVVDWFSRLPYAELKSIQEDLKKLVLLNLALLEELPQTGGNLAFLVMLMEKAEQLGEIAAFQLLYQIIEQTSFDIGHRLKAAALYLEIPNSAAEYIGFYDQIYTQLEKAYLEEEDSADKVLFTIVNYYLQVIDNCGEFNPSAPAEIRARLTSSLSENEESFLNCPLIYSVLDTDLVDVTVASTHIRSLLDVYLERTQPVITALDGLLVEEDTDYCELLKEVPLDFMAIREISVAKHMANPEGQRFYEALQRGVKILDDERELFAYMVAMGKMHRAKLISAFRSFDFSMMAGPVNVIDWGCGQGTATMVLLDYLNKERLSTDIDSIILVEPSKLSLERGSLHALKFKDTVRLVTVNSLLDAVTSNSLKDLNGTTIHLFANILDIDAVALKPLIELIKSNISNYNLFICTSPYVNSIKTNRLNTFLSAFEDDGIEVFMQRDDPKGTWINGWSRVIRVFTANL